VLAAHPFRRARLEDVYTLLRPAKDEFRNAVAEACADQPDLDQTAEFYRSELPDDLRMATSRVAERLDAPRNNISGLTGVPPLRRFFNHPTDVPLREIIQARDILIVDANMGAISSTRPTTSPAERTSSTRSPPTAPPVSSPRSACSTSHSSAPPQSTSRRSSRAC
jgi:hypothetical protein